MAMFGLIAKKVFGRGYVEKGIWWDGDESNWLEFWKFIMLCKL